MHDTCHITGKRDETTLVWFTIPLEAWYIASPTSTGCSLIFLYGDVAGLLLYRKRPDVPCGPCVGPGWPEIPAILLARGEETTLVCFTIPLDAWYIVSPTSMGCLVTSPCGDDRVTTSGVSPLSKDMIAGLLFYRIWPGVPCGPCVGPGRQ